MQISKDKQREGFAQILVYPNLVPAPLFGKPITGQNMYAVSYEDSGRKIPEWARLRLSPRMSTDMHGTQCTLYMVRLGEQENEPQLELERLIRQHETSNLMIEAVHNVYQVSDQNSANGKGRIVRTIRPNQVLYYSCIEQGTELSEHVTLFRQTVVEQLLRSGGDDILQDFKYIVQQVKRKGRQEYQFALPADLPAAFLDRIQRVELRGTAFGDNGRHFVENPIERERRILPFRPRTVKDPKETGMASAYRHFELHPDQWYLGPYLRGGNAQLVHFCQPSTTCTEKRDLLNSIESNINGGRRWTLDNIVSAHYFDGPKGYIVLVGPRLEDVLFPEQMLTEITGLDGIKKSDKLPKEMEHGTCTPFVYAPTGREAIDRIVLLQLPQQFMMEWADYSIGGRGPSAHRASIQMNPYTANTILMSEFRRKVVVVSHPYYKQYQ
ncbi:MAG: hypothetical protein ABSE71_02635 [Candidatus Micrarchaeaceae archaeon]|jgi:hypothetical protein|nr:hypothetical protein [Candidatus Micrarchaeota archaeon]